MVINTLKKRSTDNEYKLKQSEYYKNYYRERNKKVISKNNFLTSVTLNEIIVYFN